MRNDRSPNSFEMLPGKTVGRGTTHGILSLRDVPIPLCEGAGTSMKSRANGS